jgi:hypothetical protein
MLWFEMGLILLAIHLSRVTLYPTHIFEKAVGTAITLGLRYFTSALTSTAHVALS